MRRTTIAIFILALGNCAIAANADTDYSSVCTDSAATVKADDDLDRRLKIVQFSEQLGNAIVMRDINFIDRIFSDADPSLCNLDHDGRVHYVRDDTNKYLTNLKRLFARAKNIDLEISDHQVVRHSVNPDRYMETFKLDLTTDVYRDLTRFCLIWEFVNDEPVIRAATILSPDEELPELMSRDFLQP